MKFLGKFNFFGGRVFKTGVAVFVTAWISQLLSLPALFAVITAIVTLEPTASDSLKKGIIRFPASAIGAAISISLTALIGEAPLSYALAAMFTILLCYNLKLEAGILVATLTAVAMIPVTSDHYLIAFFTRLGTTSIGIIVSTLVNFIILPPKFSPLIYKKNETIFCLTANIVEITGREIFFNQPNKRKRLSSSHYERLVKEVEKSFLLCHYQREEWKYHRHTTKEMRSFQYAQKTLVILQQIIYHLGNLQQVRFKENELNLSEQKIITNTINSIASILRSSNHQISNAHYRLIEKLDEQFWHKKEKFDEHIANKYHHHFSTETTVLYEILALHDALEELEHFTKNRTYLPND